MKRKKKVDALVQIDGEIRAISVFYASDTDEVTIYFATSNDMDDMVTDWNTFNNVYGDVYYKSLAGYRRGNKYLFSDLRK